MNDASPRFRTDLEATPTETEGVPCVDVRDPKTGTNFRFYDFEYQLAQQLNGQPLGDVTAWASAAYGVDLTTDGINEFAGRLAELGFLETMPGATAAGDSTPATGTKPPDVDSAEHEWMSAEGAKTATFVPDPAMLDSPPDLTPVAPALPVLDEQVTGRAALGDVVKEDATPVPDAAKPPAPTTAPPRLFDIPTPAPAKAPPPPAEAPTAPALPASKAPPPKAAPSWALDLDGKLQSNGEAGSLTPPPMPAAAKETPGVADTKTPPPIAKAPAGAAPPRAGATPAPPGLSERRQPPAPDAVQMTPFAADGAAAAAAKPKSRVGRIVSIVIVVLAIAGIIYGLWTRERARVTQAVRVRVISPKPAAIYRWFSGRGTVTDHEARTLAIETSGTLAELLPPGTAFASGDILGRLRGAQPVEALLSRHRARLAFYQQMRESMRSANNQPELRQAEIKLADKQRLIDETNASLSKLVVRATEPGEVVETLAKVGTPIKAGAPLLRVKGRLLHGEFELDREEIADVTQLGFCRVEVIGLGPRASNAEPSAAAAGTAADVGSPEAQVAPRFVDCTVQRSDGPEGKVLHVALPENVGLVPGQPLRLARQRYDAVFPVPAAAVSGSKDQRSLWIASPAGTAERRDVVVADAADDVLVSEGLRVGDEVIVDAPADLRPGAPIVVER